MTVEQAAELTLTPVRSGVGVSVPRPDGTLKVSGRYAYSSDLWAADMLWGATLRSPHPSARIRSIDVGSARAMQGVHAVLTHNDVPGRRTYGVERPDQPVLAWDVVRYQGEPVALVAADHPETARRAVAAIVVDYEPLEPLCDGDAAIARGARKLRENDNEVHRVRIRHGDVESAAGLADVVVSGEYEIGMQDQAFLGPESGLAVPAGDGGLDLYVATQWLHVDRDQVAASLALPHDLIRMTNAGVGGAFGGREDLSVQIHAGLLALATQRAVKMVYSREESFFGHVHRHPAKLRYEHGATREGDLLYVRASIVLDGGAYASTSAQVCVAAASFACGPYVVPSAAVDCVAVYTNNPPCGAMRGFGAVQVCFAYESQMDRLAAALDLDPVALRRRNAMAEGSVTPTGQVVRQPAPVNELLERLRARPLPLAPPTGGRDPRELPGGVSNTTHGEGIRRGVGYAVGWKNIGFSGGLDDYSTARVRVSAAAGEPLVEVHTAACEVGQGGITVQAQIARTVIGIEHVVVLAADTGVGNAGSSSASRQTWLTGGAVEAACRAVGEELLGRAADRHGLDPRDLRLRDGGVASADGSVVATLAELLDEPAEATREYRPRRTTPLDENGQGDVTMAFAFSAHRAVVDVDVELGLVRLVEVATATDVGKALNPQSVEGQIEGATAQGVGLAVMEEIQTVGSRIRNPSFTDYLIPTILDAPAMPSEILELPQPDAPFGINGVGESGIVSSGPAVMAALRMATGRALERMPVRPHELAGATAAGGASA